MTQSEIIEKFRRITPPDWIEPLLSGQGGAAIFVIAKILETVSENAKVKFGKLIEADADGKWLDFLFEGFFGPRLTGETDAQYRQRKTNAINAVSRPNLLTIAHQTLDPLSVLFYLAESSVVHGSVCDTPDTETIPSLIDQNSPLVGMASTDAGEIAWGDTGFRDGLFLIVESLLSGSAGNTVFSNLFKAKAGGVHFEMLTGPLDAPAPLPPNTYGEGFYGGGNYGQ